jgi:hypothetical protein
MAEDRNFQSNYIEGVTKFQNLRTRAFIQEMLSLLRGKSTELLSFDDVRARLRLREESYKGLHDIPLERIVGSVGRYREFTNTFLPRNNETRERWGRVYAKMNSMEGVPPIDVYQVGDVYFVRDGNHRVSVARQIGAKTIQAHVTELPTTVELDPGTTLEDLDKAASYIAFLDETELRLTRPHHQSIQLSNPSAYAELLGHIYLHGQVMEQMRGEPVKMSEAAADWYDNIYRPAVTLIRKHNVLERAGEDDHTEADLYIWMIDHLRDIRRRYTHADDERRKFSHALVDYLSEKKIAIPRELLDEDDETVLLSRSQVMQQIRRENNSQS